MNRAGVVAKIHGVYWAIGALWPVVHLESFMWVTGEKEEQWLVRCLSLLMIVVGVVLLVASYRNRVTPELKWLGVGGATVMVFIDFYYTFSGVLREVYLLDGVLELVLVGLWLWVGNKGIARFAIPTT